MLKRFSNSLPLQLLLAKVERYIGYYESLAIFNEKMRGTLAVAARNI